MKIYKKSDIVTKRGHIYTSDMKYYLSQGESYCYWCKIKSVEGSKIVYDSGWRGSYDYTFTTNPEEKLNTLLYSQRSYKGFYTHQYRYRNGEFVLSL